MAHGNLETTHPTILLVEDEPALREGTGRFLRTRGYRVLTANDGQSTLAQIQQADIIILDIMLPDMTGLEVLEQLRQVSDIPVLIVTALAIYFLSQLRTLDVLLLGEDLAVTLGIDASRKRRIYMALLALLTGVLVATCGIIGFVGLVVPHLVRAFTGASHKRLLPAALFVGAIFLVIADLLSRVLLSAGDLPIGIITALIGAPLFMKLLFGGGRNFGG